MSKKYAIHSIFRTIQGEGLHSGVPAVFVRFSGCNVWSGREQDRANAALKNSKCAGICDTEFFGTNSIMRGGHYELKELVEQILEEWKSLHPPFIVLTGGEPSLQVDQELVDALNFAGAYITIETNGSNLLPPGIDWVTLSPKPPMPIVEQRYREIKVLYPLFDPTMFEKYVDDAQCRFVQPVDESRNAMLLAPERRTRTNKQLAREFVEKVYPRWRLGAQLHKVWGIP